MHMMVCVCPAHALEKCTTTAWEIHINWLFRYTMSILHNIINQLHNNTIMDRYTAVFHIICHVTSCYYKVFSMWHTQVSLNMYNSNKLTIMYVYVIMCTLHMCSNLHCIVLCPLVFYRSFSCPRESSTVTWLAETS